MASLNKIGNGQPAAIKREGTSLNYGNVGCIELNLANRLELGFIFCDKGSMTINKSTMKTSNLAFKGQTTILR